MSFGFTIVFMDTVLYHIYREAFVPVYRYIICARLFLCICTLQGDQLFRANKLNVLLEYPGDYPII